MPRQIPGRPLNDLSVRAILLLEDSELYQAKDVARKVFDRETQAAEYRDLRVKLNSFINYHAKNAPDSTTASGRFWKGRTWKSFLDPADISRVEKMPGKRPFRRLRKRYFLVAALCLSFLMVGGTSILRPKVYQILNEEGLEAALSYLGNPGKKSSPEQTFQMAWLKYREGKFAEAQTMAHELLSNESITVKIEADCQYLLGHLATETGKSQEAITHFLVAQSIYEDLNRPQNLYVNTLGMTKALILSGDFDQAEDHLEKALGYHEAAPRQTKYESFLQLSILFHERLGEYPQVLRLVEEVLKRFHNSQNEDLYAEALSTKAYSLAALGDYHASLELSLRAGYEFFRFGDERQYMFNMVNFVAILNCQGESVQSLSSKIEAYAEKNQDAFLLQHLESSLALECGERL
jgi:tetratricopeptide (TPR) repeat protein